MSGCTANQHVTHLYLSVAYSDVMKIIPILATVLSVIPFALSIFMPSWYIGDEQNAVEAADRKGEHIAPLPGTVTTDEGTPRNEKLESPWIEFFL